MKPDDYIEAEVVEVLIAFCMIVCLICACGMVAVFIGIGG